MAFAYKVAKVTFSGDCFLGTEEWSTGFYMGFENVDVPNPTAQSAQDLSGWFGTFWANSLSHINNNYRHLSTKVALMNTSGTTDLNNTFTYHLATPLAAGGGATIQPPQIALVATLMTAVPRGLGSKGRMYLPGVNVAISGNTGKFASFTHATDIATTLQTLINGINADADIPGEVILASKGRTGAQSSPPINRIVNSLRVGDVYDTQRRRRNQLVETYSTKTIP